MDEINALVEDDAFESDPIDEIIRDVVGRIDHQSTRLVALALKRGYDGVDFVKNETSPRDVFRFGLFEPEAWREEPPERAYNEQYIRWDFRHIPTDEREHIMRLGGVQPDMDHIH